MLSDSGGGCRDVVTGTLMLLENKMMMVVSRK
jgi:hypothetical protein